MRGLITTTTLALSAGIINAERIVQYKTSIDLTLSGQRGVDWEIEDLYHDPKVMPRSVIYVKDSTQIGFARNERNSYRSGANAYATKGGTQGTIRYKVDGDMNRKILWAGPNNRPPAYSDPFSFSSLNYGIYGDGGVPVIGTTGPKPGITAQIGNSTRYYWRGIRGPFGDEWHTLSVGDDDSSFVTAGTGTEWQASDGVIFVFNVNAKTPCLRWTKTGNGEFYTTPAKTYGVPKIHEQITYIDPNNGSVSVTLTNLSGGDVFYKINGGNVISVAGGTATITHTQFNLGSNQLTYYSEGNEDRQKTRTVVLNPDFPSRETTHGDRFWGGVSNWPAVKAKLGNHGDWWLDQWFRGGTNNNLDRIERFGSGRRTYVGSAVTHAAENAVLMRYYGAANVRAGRSYSWGEYALKSLLEASSTIDPLGFEVRHTGNAKPSMEFSYRGYYDVNDFIDNAFTYDVVAGYFREDQHEKGMTPIEDYLIRDLLAAYVHIALIEMGGGVGSGALNKGGMWDTARKTGAYAIMCAMPDYSTPYFGTSGLDGNDTVYPDTPFPDDAYTWKKLFVDNDAPLRGWPNLARRFGVDDYMLTAAGNFNDRLSYTDTPLMGHCFCILGNLWKIFTPEADFPHLEAYFKKCAEGKVTSTVEDVGQGFRANAGVQNGFFPYVRSVGRPKMLGRPGSDGQSLGKQFQRGGPLYVVWYDQDLVIDSQAPERTSGPVFTPGSGSYVTTQSVSLNSSTSGATIYYTVDGSAPTSQSIVYTGPIEVSVNQTIRAFASAPALSDSTERSATYTIGSFSVAQPVIAPTSVTFLTELPNVTISTATPGATIHYTLDGSAPTNESPVYTDPISLTETATIRAFARKSGATDSSEVSRSYNVGEVTSEPGIFTPASFAEKQGVFFLVIDVTPDAYPVNQLVGLADEFSSDFSFPNYSAIGRFKSTGIIDAWKNNTERYQAETQMTYRANTVYTFVFEVNLPNKTYNLTVYENLTDNDTDNNGVENTGVVIAENYSFRKANVTSLKHLVVWSSGAGDYSLTADEPGFGDELRPPKRLRVIPDGN